MKIATYNIWNDESTLELRAKQILEEIRAVDADVIDLQEVSADFPGSVVSAGELR